MVDETEIIINRGLRAKQLLEDDILKESIQIIKDSAMSAWIQTAPDEYDERERLWLSYQIISDVEKVLHGVINTGEMSEHNLSLLKSEDLKKQ